jgi:hypothetical protein
VPKVADLPEILQLRLKTELRPFEVVLWTGQPVPKQFMKGGYKALPFYVFWTALTIVWMVAAANFSMPTFDRGFHWFPLFGLPFFLVGLAGLVEPLWMRRRASWIVYAVTNHRAIELDGRKSFKVKSYFPSDLTDMERTEHGDGSGDLILRKEYTSDSDGHQQSTPHGFFAIHGVREPEQLLHILKHAKRI